MAIPGLRFYRAKWTWLVVLILGTGILVGSPHAWAWYQLRQARESLSSYHPDQARVHLSQSMRIWPDSQEVLLLQARAAWQQSNFGKAVEYLEQCQSHLDDKTSREIAMEWALVRAASGYVQDVEEFLQSVAEEAPDQATVIWEAMAEGYIRIYRILDALAMLDHWLKLDPNNLRALELRGLAFQNGHSAKRGSADLAKVLELDPQRDQTRWRLILCLLDMGSYEQALPHLQHLEQKKPKDPDIQVGIARCRRMLGEEGTEKILDRVLKQGPDHVNALRVRGQFALVDREPDKAEQWLKKAVEKDPSDYQSQWLLYRALLEQGKKEEAEQQLKVAQETKGQSERLGELTSRQLSQQPLNPALHYEMGMLLLRAGHEKTAESWWLSAIRLDNRFRPAHRALADYYEKQGMTDKAAEHRRLAEASVEPKP